MLSIENHSPTDSNEILLNRVDLSNSSLDDHNPAPKFSIRDFVFNARSKDIKTNWPFSQKSLQLCLDHGVKDLLPPFQCLDCVKNCPREKDGVESSSSGKRKIINMDSEMIVGSVKSDVLDSCNKQIPVTINIPLPQEVNTKTPQMPKAGNRNPSGFDSCNEFLSATDNPSFQQVSPKTPEKSLTHFPKKPEISKPSSIKKCRLTLKVGLNGVEPNSNSYSGSTIAEPMGSSKLCPVCKKCSFSSNTTLNAHIDQCLSMDSPIEPVSKSMVVKHKIKPKKTRSVVDIYATAPHCTIEELDRRNGRTWIEKPNLLPTIQEDDERDYGEEKKKKVDPGEKGDDGVVYIDSNGTKVRILNKINDTSLVPKLGVSHRRLGNSLKGDKAKKKKKHTKYLKLLSSEREKTCSYKTRLASRVLEDQEKAMTLEENPKKYENIDRNATQISKSREKFNNSETIILKWGSSNRTDLLERRFKRNLSVDNSYLERSSAQKSKQIDNSSCEGPIANNHEEPPSKKQMGFKSFESQSINSMDKKVSPSRKQILSVDQSFSCEPKSSKFSPFRAKNGDYYNEKLQRRVDEDAGNALLKRSTILKIKKKKSPAIISQRNESTNDRETCEILPSSRVNSHFEDDLFNGKLPAPGGEIVIGQSSGTDSANVLSLTKSFDKGFYSICDTDMETDNEVGNYFSGVDPITIPGPPGSFLPSPGRSSSDEDHHGNSSLTTSQLQSSVDHLETAKRDSSNSPKSANSAVSNLLIVSSDLKLTENMAQDEIIKLGFSDEITKSTLGFEDSRQPCCCSRKEDVLVNCQESQLMRRRVMSTFPDPMVDKPSNFSQDNTLFPSAESGVGPVSVKVPIKPSVYGDFGSPSPSAPSPVLRLMGKNLVVANNDENINQSPNLKFQTGSSDNHVRQMNPSYGHKGMDFDLHENNFSSLNRSFGNPFSPLRYNKSESVGTLSDPFQNAVHSDGMNVIRTSSGGFPIPLSGYYNSGNLNPFHNYPGTEFLNYRDPHMIPNVSSPLSHQSSDPMRWNNSVLEGSSMLPQSPLNSSPSTNRARSSLYFSPSMS